MRNRMATQDATRKNVRMVGLPFVGAQRSTGNSRSVDFHAPSELLVLVADELDHLVVWRNLLIDPKREWLCVRFRVVERDVDFQLAVCGPANALGELRLVRVRAAADVEPPVGGARLRSPQIVRFDDERVAFPSSD